VHGFQLGSSIQRACPCEPDALRLSPPDDNSSITARLDLRYLYARSEAREDGFDA
jgi:hypothetical protein